MPATAEYEQALYWIRQMSFTLENAPLQEVRRATLHTMECNPRTDLSADSTEYSLTASKMLGPFLILCGFIVFSILIDLTSKALHRHEGIGRAVDELHTLVADKSSEADERVGRAIGGLQSLVADKSSRLRGGDADEPTADAALSSSDLRAVKMELKAEATHQTHDAVQAVTAAPTTAEAQVLPEASAERRRKRRSVVSRLQVRKAPSSATRVVE